MIRPWVLNGYKKSHKILCSHIFIIHNDHTYITEDYTKLCLNIICNRSFFILKWFQLCSGPSFTQGWKDIGAKTYLFTACKNCYLRFQGKFIFKTGNKYPINLIVTQLFDLNARIQQLTWSLIFYEKYSTSLSYLWFWPPLIWGGSVISASTIHDLRRVKVPGTGPLWNPWSNDYFIKGWFQLSNRFQTRRFVCEFPTGFYVKLSSAVEAILVGERDCRTQFWKRTIQWLCYQSLVAIEQLVPDKKIFMWISHRFLC